MPKPAAGLAGAGNDVAIGIACETILSIGLALVSTANFKQQMRVRVLAARGARGLRFVVPPKEGAGNVGCALHPQSRVQKAERKAHTSIQGSRHRGVSP
jgi:hypothetical protein